MDSLNISPASSAPATPDLMQDYADSETWSWLAADLQSLMGPVAPSWDHSLSGMQPAVPYLGPYSLSGSPYDIREPSPAGLHLVNSQYSPPASSSSLAPANKMSSRRQEQNRAAQRAYRQRHKTLEADLKAEVRKLENVKDEQQARIRALENELERMQQGIFSHLATAHGVDVSALQGASVTFTR